MTTCGCLRRVRRYRPSSSTAAVVCLAGLLAEAWCVQASANPTASAGVEAKAAGRLNYEAVSNGPWKVRPLPGHPFTFTMYGCPGEPNRLKELVAVMKEQRLGNGFDPGPSARAESAPLFEVLASVGWPVICYPGYSDMQIKEGRSRLSDADEAAMRILDRAGVFSGIQLGEWGYFFHHLSTSEPWFRDVYPEPEVFKAHKHLIKPAGLAGYDTRPKSRRECYEVLKDYYLTRNRYIRARNISVTGHSHYEAYAAEWGAGLIGLELGENIAHTQSKIAFARGASRQWDRPWSIQISPWYAGSCTTAGPLKMEGNYARGLDAGHSLSLYQRMWLHAWFAGTAMVTPENSSAIFFERSEAPWPLTSHGRKAAEVFTFTQGHDRGVPYTPVAVVLDHLAGYQPFGSRPWGILDITPGDRETLDLFGHQLYPGSAFHGTPLEHNEQGFMRPTPYGEMFDVVLSSAKAEMLGSYPVILLVGDITFDPGFVCELHRALRMGSRLLLHPRHAQALGDDGKRLMGTGRVEVLECWTNPATQRPAAISHDRLLRLSRECLPVGIEGDAVQYQINRNRSGWVVELIHNGGVTKKPAKPAEVDSGAVANVVVRPRFAVRRACEWRSDKVLADKEAIRLTIPPGESMFVELMPE